MPEEQEKVPVEPKTPPAPPIPDFKLVSDIIEQLEPYAKEPVMGAFITIATAKGELQLMAGFPIDRAKVIAHYCLQDDDAMHVIATVVDAIAKTYHGPAVRLPPQKKIEIATH